MKIAVDAYHAIFPSGGISRYARGLISAITEITPTDEFILFYNRFRERGKAWRPTKGNSIVRQIYFPRHLLQGIWDFIEWPPIEILCGSIDLFHGLHFVLPPGRKAHRVLTVHDLTYLKYPQYYYNLKLNERGYQHELPRSLRRADHVIAISRTTKNDLIEIFNFPPDRITTVYPGVESIFFSPVSQKEISRVLGRYRIRGPYFVFVVGTNEPRKNIPRTIVAFQRAREILTEEISLVIIGRGLHQFFQNREHTGVIPIGFVPEEELPALLQGAAISLYPSLYEGFGLPVLESMACGTPVITSNISSMPEVGGNAACYVNPLKENEITDAIVDLYLNSERKKKLSQLGKDRAREFSWQSTAEKTLAIYKKTLRS